MAHKLVALGALNGLISVAAGAFGAHALKARLDARSLEIFETAARYHMYHALAMILWVMYGYGLAFGGDASQFVSSGKYFLAGVNADSAVATFTDGVEIPEFVFIAFR